MDDRPARRLAAIVAADIAGYSRLMERDEEAAVLDIAARLESLGASVGISSGRDGVYASVTVKPRSARSSSTRAFTSARLGLRYDNTCFLRATRSNTTAR